MYMGIIKGCFKVAGTAALIVTGTASAILKGVSETGGFELGSELFGSTKEASFNGIKKMWSNGEEEREEFLEGMSDEADNAARRKLADTAYRAAQIAKENGDVEKYERYMDQYYAYKD